MHKYKYTQTYILVFFAILASLLMYPLELRYWITYGFSLTEPFIDNYHIIQNDFCLNIASQNLGFIKYFNYFAKYIYETPLYFIIASLLLKACELLIIYGIIKFFINDNKSAFIYSIIFIILGGMSMLPNGLFGPIYFTKAYISALISLLSIYTILRKKFYLSGTLVFLACYFHIIWGAAAFIFITTGFYLDRILAKDFKSIIKFSFMSFITMIPFAYQFIELSLSTNNLIDLKLWYDSLNNDDIFMINTLIYESGAIFIPLTTYFLFRKYNEKKDIVHIYIISGLIIIFSCLIIELFHDLGYFFGKASELFLGIQIRRGIWVTYLTLYIACIKLLWEHRDSYNTTWTCALLTLFYFIRPNYHSFAIIIIILYVIYIVDQRKKWWHYILPINAILWIPTYYIYVYYYKDITFNINIFILKNIIFILIFTSIFTIPWLKKLTNEQKIIIPIIIFILITTLSRAPTWFIDLHWLHKRGWLSTVKTAELQNHLDLRSKRKSALYGNEDYEDISSKILSFVTRLNVNYEPVFYPSALALDGYVPSVHSRLWCADISLYSRSAASLIFPHLQKIYGLPKNYNHLNINYLDNIYDSFSAGHIKNLFDKGIMGIFISKSIYSELQLVKKIGPYYIYKKKDIISL